MARNDPRDDPRYQAIRNASQRRNDAVNAANALAGKVGSNEIPSKLAGGKHVQDLLAACDGDSGEAMRLFNEACSRHGMSTGFLNKAKKALFNR